MHLTHRWVRRLRDTGDGLETSEASADGAAVLATSSWVMRQPPRASYIQTPNVSNFGSAPSASG